MTTNHHQIRVVRYTPTDRTAVQAFVDVQLGDLLRLNGICLLRSGDIRIGQLTPAIRGRRAHIDCLQVLDPQFRESWAAAIKDAIDRHVASLPAGQRAKPPHPPEPRRPDSRPQPVASAEPQNAREPIKPAPAVPPRALVRPKPIEPVRTAPAPVKSVEPIIPQPRLEFRQPLKPPVRRTLP